MKLTPILQEIASNAVKGDKPVAVVFGTVTNTSPLSVKISDLLELPSATLIQTSVVKNQLASGDSVILLRQQGGQKYIILDKYEVAT